MTKQRAELNGFLDAVLDGRYGGCREELLRFTVTSNDSEATKPSWITNPFWTGAKWPLIYIEMILKKLYGIDISLLTKHYLSSDGRGKGWEMVVQVAVLLRCWQAATSCCSYSKDGPFGIFFSGGDKETLQVEHALVEGATLEEVDACIMEKMAMSGDGVVVATPTNASFSTFDGLLYCKRTTAASGKKETEWQKIGYQMKLGRQIPKDCPPRLPGFIGRAAYLINGEDPPEFGYSQGKVSHDTAIAWHCMGEDEIRRLLGSSFQHFLPPSLASGRKQHNNGKIGN